MRVAEPVWRNGGFDAGAIGRFADNAQHGCRAEPPSVLLLAGPEDRIMDGGLRCSQGADQFPNGRGHLNGSCFTAFAENSDLPAIAIRLQVPPGKFAQLADPDPGSIEEGEQRPVARIRFQAQDTVEVGLGENALSQPVADGGQSDRTPDVEG